MKTKHENIDNPARLQAWVESTESQIARLTADVKSQAEYNRLDIPQTKIGEWTDEQKGAFGGLLKDLLQGKIDTIGSIEVPIKAKALTGTPLTSDAVTGSSVTGEQYIADILALAESMSHLRPFVKKVDMIQRVANYPDENATPDFVYVSTDSNAMSEGTMTFATPLVLTAYNYAFWVSFTESLLEDSLINLGDYFRVKAAGAWARKFDYEFLRGSGSPTTGVLEHGSVNEYDMSSQAFADLSDDDLFGALQLLDTEPKREGSMWIFSPTVGDIIWQIQDANGNYKFRDALTMGPAGRILGYPWIYSGQMPASSDTSGDTAFIAVGNPRHLIFGDRISLEIKKFDQMASTAEYGEVVLRARTRMAFAIGEPTAWARISTSA